MARPSDKPRVTTLIYGGAFDPPHRAHIELPLRVMTSIGADRLLYMPAAAPPLKKGPIASAHDRICLLKAAIGDAPDVSVSDLEIRRGGTSFTIDTLRTVHTELGDGQSLRLLIGVDQAMQFQSWREAREIITLAEPVVMIRPPTESIDAAIDAMAPHWTVAELEQWRGRFVDVSAMDVSSTLLRDAIRDHGPDSPLAQQWIPAPALAIIRDRGLYVS